MFLNHLLKFIILSFTAALLFSACRGDRSKNPPVVPVQNMLDQTSFREQSKNDFFKDKRSYRKPVNGTIATDEHFTNSSLYYGLEAGSTPEAPKWVTKIPVKLTPEIMKLGQKNYNIYCAPCHGIAGHNDGLITLRAAGTIRPANLHDQEKVNLPVGKIYDAVSNGVNNWNMPGFIEQMSVEDRWAVVAYVRALQASERASEEEFYRAKK